MPPRTATLPLALGATAAVLALLVLAVTARLDLSFRPLFTDDPAVAAATAAFEAGFGQPSGEWFGALVEHEHGLTPELRARLGQLSAELAALPHVTGVASPATVRDEEVVRRGGRLFAVLVRTDLPLADLHGRTRLLERLRGGVETAVPAEARVHYVGVSVVEAAYAHAVPRSMARSLVLTLGAVAALLWLLFGRVRDVAIVLAGVSVAVPVSLALLTLAGGAITMLNSMVPTVLLVIGVADAIHIRLCWEHELRRSTPVRAVRRAVVRMALPCALTTLTTALGFLSLGVADVNAIRSFGFAVAAGVCVLFVANMMMVPALLRSFGGVPEDPGDGTAATFTAVGRLRRALVMPLGRGALGIALAAARRPVPVLLATAVFFVVAGAGALRMRSDQRFNEELPADHPARVAQALVESEFGGFLGPELEIARRDGSPIADPGDDDATDRVRLAAAAVAALPAVDHVAELFAGGRAALVVRIPDIGTAAALPFADSAAATALAALGPEYDVRIVGQWYLAQLGMASLLRDMLVSFALCALLVLPVLAAALRSRRLFAIAILPNLLPMLAALAFMGFAGITLRIGTALVLAIALAIAVDDTIHMLMRLDSERRRGASPEAAVATALRETGAALLLTTLVLAAGFLSMLASDLAAIRDMGLVATVALTAALLADVFIAPALFLALERHAAAIGATTDGEPARARARAPAHTGRMRLRHSQRVATSSVGSAAQPGIPTLHAETEVTPLPLPAAARRNQG